MHFSPSFPQVPAWLAGALTALAWWTPPPATCWRIIKTFLSLIASRKETPMNAQNLFQLLQTAAQVAPALVALEEAETNPLTPAEKKAAVLAAVASLDAKVIPLLNLPAELVAVLENTAALSFAYDLISEGAVVVEELTHRGAPTEAPVEQLAV